MPSHPACARVDAEGVAQTFKELVLFGIEIHCKPNLKATVRDQTGGGSRPENGCVSREPGPGALEEASGVSK